MSKELQQSMSMIEELGPADAQFDLRFMNAMIAHHQGAVTMETAPGSLAVFRPQELFQYRSSHN